MKRVISSLIFGAVMLLMNSCSSYIQTSAGVKLPINSPDKLEYNLNLRNQTLLGEVEISVDYRTYLGIFYKIDKINGEEKVRRNHKYVSFTSKNNGYWIGLAYKGRAKVLESYPDADYFIVSGSEKEKTTMFLGSNNKRTVTYKAYKFSETPVEPVSLYRKKNIYK